MTRTIVVLVVLLLGASNAGATDINDKWGIGASVFNSSVETTLIRGVSDRTAWVLGLTFSGSNSDRTTQVSCPSCGFPLFEGNANLVQIDAGPALRRFTRPASEFSPYGDLFVSFGYGRFRDGTGGSSFTDERVGAGAGLAFGLEYFTRWHFSLAAHTDVLTARWNRDTLRLTGSLGVLNHTTVDRFEAQASLAPRLVLRAYF